MFPGRKYLFQVFLFLGTLNFSYAQVADRVDSIIHSWEINGIPKGRESDYKEYQVFKKKIREQQEKFGDPSELKNFPIVNSMQSDSCHNSGFEAADYSYWYRFQGSCSIGNTAPNGTYPSSGYIPPGSSGLNYNSPISGNVFTLINTQPGSNISGVGYDPYAKSGSVYTLPMVNSQAGSYVARINNDQHESKAERMEYVFNVPITHPYFVYRYAAVMSDGGHNKGEQSGIRVKSMYMNGNLLPISNPIYETFATGPGMTLSSIQQTNSGSSSADVYYKTWTTDTIFLCPFVGQNVRISFEALDCIYGGHFCYMYVDAACNYGPPLNTAVVQSSMCMDSTNFTLTAPAGYSSYQWYDANGNPISVAQTGNQQALDLNAYVKNCPLGNCTLYDGEKFSVSVNSPGGCSVKINVVLHLLSVKFEGFTAVPTCKDGNNGSLSVTATGGLGSGTYNFNWYANSCTGASIGSGATISNLYTGNYCVHITSGQCPPADTVLHVGMTPMIPQHEIQNLPPCADSLVYIYADESETGYTWYQNGSLIPGQNLDSLGINPYVFNALYEVTYFDSMGCRDSLIINPHMDLPGVKLGSFVSGATCKEGHNGSLAVNVTGGLGAGTYNFSWYANNCSGTPIGNASSISNLYTGNYCVHVASGHCPPLDTTLHIGIIPMVPQYETQSLPPCLDSVAYIKTDKNDSAYTWYQNGVLIPDQSADSLKINPVDFNSKYEVTYYDANGCLDSMIITPDMHLFTTTFNAVYCPRDSVAKIFLETPPGTSEIQWYHNGVPVADSLGGASDSLTYFIYVSQVNAAHVLNNDTLSGYYAVYYVNGCRKLAGSPVEIFPSEVFIPDTTVSIFTPNNDGINDIFYPFATKDYNGLQIAMQTDNYELSVFNRWGNPVFHSDSYIGGWDGRNNMHEPMSEGTYFWIAKFKSNCNNAENGKITEKGFVHLAR